jgi:hypothetical protein
MFQSCRAHEPIGSRTCDANQLLSPPLYGDRSAIGHNWEGEKANRAFVLSLGVWECHYLSNRFGVWFTSPAGKSSLLFLLGAKQTVRVFIGTKFGFYKGIWNLVWISVLLA